MRLRSFDPVQLPVMGGFLALVLWGFQVAGEVPADATGSRRAGPVVTLAQPSVRIADPEIDLGPVTWRIEGEDRVLASLDGREVRYSFQQLRSTRRISKDWETMDYRIVLQDGRRIRFVVTDYTLFSASFYGLPAAFFHGNVRRGRGSGNTFWWITEDRLHLFQGSGRGEGWETALELAHLRRFSFQQGTLTIDSGGSFRTRLPVGKAGPLVEAVLETLGSPVERPPSWAASAWKIELDG
ncbi:MAG: hypothetical protein ACE5H3_09380 [Planctomycetota bacterium]